ncbi:MAG: formyltransferase family protein [Burkholderiales bacterium]
MNIGGSPIRHRVVLCTSGGLFGAAVLRRVLGAAEIEVVGVVISTRNFKLNQSLIGATRFALRQFGARYLHYITVSTLLADFWGGISRKSTRAIATTQKIPIHECEQINDSLSLQWMGALKPDVVLSAFFNQKIGESVLKLSSKGVLNIHPSLLPRFRGVDPVFQMQRRGEVAYGATLHRVDLELDEGNIIEQAALSPPQDGSTLNLTARSFELGADLFVNAIRDGTAFGAGFPQSLKGQSDCYDSWPTREQVEEFTRRGERLWRWSDLSTFIFGRYDGKAPTVGGDHIEHR